LPVRLVCFDIDGTILTASGAGRRAIQAALREVFGSTGPAGYWFDGKTDRQIVRDLMRADGFPDAVIDARMDAVLSRYLELLADELERPEHRPYLHAGVSELLDALAARDDIVLGLLTGNLEAGARAKLGAVGIDPTRFPIGAYGSDHEDRPELPAVAIRRMREMRGVDLPEGALVVIGDTPHDITCGRAVGARAIGVATGRYSVQELCGHGAAAVFPDLSDTATVVARIIEA
jgi:phosphoglycolate phosphatase-like HAD superfamily hydrolase